MSTTTTKSRIFLTGDTHRRLDLSKLSLAEWPEQQTLTKEDYVIILGDFGGIWHGDDFKNTDGEDTILLDEWEDRPFTTLFIDGNHENFAALSQYPKTTKRGGDVHEIRPHVFHLMRGQIFTLNDNTFFTFGGAVSLDQYMREPYISWWPEELPTWQETEDGLKTLEAHDNQVDYILTHDCPGGLLPIMYPHSVNHQDSVNQYFDVLRENITFKHWYFGHHHTDQVLSSKYTALYQNIIELKDETTS